MTPSRRRWIVAVAAAGAVALTARLGVWQLDRAAQKTALQAAIESRGRMPALSAASLPRAAAAAEAEHYRPVRLRGRWLAGRTVYLDNRQMNGHPGFYVLTPLLLSEGDAVVVQRGWVPRNLQQRTQLPPVETPQGMVEILGRIAPPPSKLFEFSGAASGPIRQNLELDAYAAEIGVHLRPLSVQQLDEGGVRSAGDLLRDWPRPALDVQKHYGYAFQWFAMSALITGLYVWFQLLRPRIAARRAA